MCGDGLRSDLRCRSLRSLGPNLGTHLEDMLLNLTDIWNFVILSVVNVPKLPQLRFKGFKLIHNVHQILKYGFELNQFKMGFIYYIKLDRRTEPVENIMIEISSLWKEYDCQYKVKEM